MNRSVMVVLRPAGAGTTSSAMKPSSAYRTWDQPTVSQVTLKDQRG
jgi:hypothetical protein